MSIYQKKVSIILNCYNGEKYLKDALISIINQSYKNWELIFWDNRSNDNSKNIFKSFKNKNFKYFLAKKHTSLYEARNLAIKKASGEYLGFIDADDMWDRNKLLKQVKLFKDNDTAVVYSNSWLKDENNKRIKKYTNKNLNSGYIYQDLINNYNIQILTAIIKRSILKKHNITFNKRFNIIGDFDFFIRLAKKFKFRYFSEPVAIYRLHRKNLSLLKKELFIKELTFWLKKNKKNLDTIQIKKIEQKIVNLQFLQKKFSKNSFSSITFFMKYLNILLNFKNLIILGTPRFILKKYMWYI